jgi:hypothetical protein
VTFSVPIDRRTGQVAKTPYAVGRELGQDGSPMHAMGYSQSGHNEAYRAGWYDGYRDALLRELREYNRQHGTNWEARI